MSGGWESWGKAEKGKSWEGRKWKVEKVAKWAGGKWQVAGGRWQEAVGCVKGTAVSCLARTHCTVEIPSFFGLIVSHFHQCQEELLKRHIRSEKKVKSGVNGPRKHVSKLPKIQNPYIAYSGGDF